MKELLNPRSWNLDRFLMVFTALMVVVGALLMPIQSDTWWLLRIGQDTVANQAVATIEPYSFTARGAYWPNHEWLSSVIAYGLYALGGTALLIAGFAALIIGAWWLLARECAGPPRVVALVLLLGIIASAAGWSVRPQVFTWLCFTLAIVLLKHPRRLWLYPVLFLVWANLHSGVASGGLILIVATGVAAWRFRADLKHWFIITLVCGAMTLLNPLGWGIIEFTLNTITENSHAFIEEWQPQRLSNPLSYPYFIMAFWFGWTLWKHWRLLESHRDWTLAVTGMVFAVLALRSGRHTPFFVLTTLPILSLPFRTKALQQPIGLSQGRLYQATMGVLALGGIAAVVLSPRPLPLTRSIQTALIGCPGLLYNTFMDGGPILWFVQEQAVFIDNRYDPYPKEIFHLANAIEDTGDYEPTFQQYNIRCALVPTTSPLEARLRSDGWIIAAESETHTVFYR